MKQTETRGEIRVAARAYEESLPILQRKQLGQFFTGLPLGKLLAHLALKKNTRTVLDPMAGHGDLLDATWEAAIERGIHLERLDGIEIDENTATACRNRLSRMAANDGGLDQLIVEGDAFDPRSVQMLPHRMYDLVITNPPYVRHQARHSNRVNGDQTRSGLVAILGSRLRGPEKDIWGLLAESYSGLADLSVPAWLHAASFVRPGGHLALVVPATWRSRDYADVTRYLLLRCFNLEYIVEDVQPGWFSDALVRTHLLVARRLTTDEIARPAKSRTDWPTALWLQIAPAAADTSSLVGAAFGGDTPEMQLAAWMGDKCLTPQAGISVRPFPLQEEWDFLASRIRGRHWYQRLEGQPDDLPLFGGQDSFARAAIPDALRDILPSDLALGGLSTLQEAGIEVGQGLRTGCNGFFYVKACGANEGGMALVEASSLFNGQRFLVPIDAIRPVLRKQSELGAIERGDMPDGCVLDLRDWVLPEDAKTVALAKAAYAERGESLPRTMPTDLAEYVRMASTTRIKGQGGTSLIPQLSAVRTNVRCAKNGKSGTRFWYMLPDFAPRHLPGAFVPRINHGMAWVESNHNPAMLIDANFSTFWVPQGDWTCHALKALLDSSWCRAFMEALGTPFGGGALKLEATHLRHIPVPILSNAARKNLDEAGKSLTRTNGAAQSRIDDIIFNAALSPAASRKFLPQLANSMIERAQRMACARQKAA